MLVRRLPPHLPNLGTRLVKSPTVYLRDSGLLHALLGLATVRDLQGHPVAGASWEGFVVEQVAAQLTAGDFYRERHATLWRVFADLAGKREPIDEIRHEDDPDTIYRMD